MGAELCNYRRKSNWKNRDRLMRHIFTRKSSMKLRLVSFIRGIRIWFGLLIAGSSDRFWSKKRSIMIVKSRIWLLITDGAALFAQFRCWSPIRWSGALIHNQNMQGRQKWRKYFNFFITTPEGKKPPSVYKTWQMWVWTTLESIPASGTELMRPVRCLRNWKNTIARSTDSGFARLLMAM